MANIPKAREILAQALEYNMDSKVRVLIEEAMQEMYRDFIGRKAPTTSAKITPYLVRRIKAFAEDNPSASYKAIANHFNVNQGRVSEALSGKYDGGLND